MVDRAADRPPFRQIADALRTAIVSGELAPGARLPSEQQLTQQYDVDRSTVRRALDVLRAEGRIVSRKGAGSFAAERPTLRRMQTELTIRADRRGWYAALDAAGRPASVQTNVRRGPAPAHIAALLGTGSGEPVLLRERLMGIEGERPIQLATSYVPLDVADQVPQLQSLDTGPGGMLSRFEDAGYGSLYFDEIVSARAPLPREAASLQLSPGIPVLIVHRLTYSRDGQVLDAMERVIAADRCELAYRFGAYPED